MAATGILLRRGPSKSTFDGLESPLRGELVMATNTTEFGWLDDNNTVVWGRLENELPTEGDEGQILTKSSDDDYDVIWSDAPETGNKKYREYMMEPSEDDYLIINFDSDLVLVPGENHIFKVYLSFPLMYVKGEPVPLYQEYEITINQYIDETKPGFIAEVRLKENFNSSRLATVYFSGGWNPDGSIMLQAYIDDFSYEIWGNGSFVFGAEYIETQPALQEYD